MALYANLSDKRIHSPPFTLEQQVCHRSITTTASSSGIRSGTDTSEDDELDAEIPGKPLLVDQSVNEYLYSDLSVKLLNDIHSYLWVEQWYNRMYRPSCNRERHRNWEWKTDQGGIIHSIHYQRMMGRDIVITEDPCLHLAWCGKEIFIKPLPLYLLRWKIFNSNICHDEELNKYALGFLLTYVALLRSRSDFNRALEIGLIPVQLTWSFWSTFAACILPNLKRDRINQRYDYGELEIRVINTIFRFWDTSIPFRFVSSDARWHTSYIKLWVLAFAYFTIILGSIQVILPANPDDAFREVYYRFSLFSMMVVIGSLGLGVTLAFTVHYVGGLVGLVCRCYRASEGGDRVTR